MNISCFIKEFDKLQEGNPCVNKIGCLKDCKILKVVVSESLTKMNDKMFYVGIPIKWEGIWLFLFSNSFTVDTITHNCVKVFDGNGAKVENFYDFDFQLYSVGGCPSIDHCIHEFSRILVKQYSDQIDNEVLYALLDFKSAKCQVKLFVVCVEFLELE